MSEGRLFIWNPLLHFDPRKRNGQSDHESCFCTWFSRHRLHDCNAQVSVEIQITMNISSVETTLQSYFDEILPCFLPMLTFMFMYWLLGKKVSPTIILMGLVVYGCVTAALGIF
ncbi:MAG: PTS system mannose/fructose/sorbose family transporter subunit IID [Bulleidia sp.]